MKPVKELRSYNKLRVEMLPRDHVLKAWILKKHYAHRMPSITFAYGAYINRKLLGICTFGTPASPSLCVGICGPEYKSKVIELNRLCVEDDSGVITSEFVSRCLSHVSQSGGTRIHPTGYIVVSYADTAQGHIGKIYQATNWLYTGITKERTDIFTGEGKHSRHYEKGRDYSRDRQPRSAKHRYVYFLGSRGWKLKARKAMKYPILPYPEGDTQRYDASAEIIKQPLLFEEEA